MKLKLDENLGRRGAAIFRAAGHDVATVHDQKLSGAGDAELIEVCRVESRCLVSLDLDFANTLRFVPHAYSGIAVLRLPSTQNEKDLLACCNSLVAALARASIVGKLWIVQPGRLREHDPDGESDGPPPV